MNIFKAIAMGNALTKLTNVWEAIGYTRETMLIGAGGGFDSLPRAMQEELAPKIPKWLATLGKHPRHIVTQELLKNARISDHLGRHAREVAQYELLQWLIEQGIAMDLDTFGKSYAN
jgi:hypothetical protein